MGGEIEKERERGKGGGVGGRKEETDTQIGGERYKETDGQKEIEIKQKIKYHINFD